MDKIQKGEIVFARLLLPLIMGIGAGYLLPINAVTLEAVIVVSLVLLLLFGVCVFFYSEIKLYLRRWKVGLIAWLWMLFLGLCLTILSDQRLSKSHFTRSKFEALVVRINSEPKLKGDILRFEGKVTQGLKILNRQKENCSSH